MLHSLRARIGLASTLLLPLIIGLTALLLDQAYRSSLEETVRERLQLQTYVLLGAAEAGGGELWLPPSLQEVRFNQPGSGLSGFATTIDQQLLWRSESSLGEPVALPPLPPEVGEPLFGRMAEGAFFYSYRVLWETELGQQSEFVFTALEQPQRFEAALQVFRSHLWIGLALLGVLLLLVQALLVRWGLAPLQRLATDVESVEAGDSDRLSSDVPREIKPLVTNLNLLLESERSRRQRYHNTLADLAHSLKTPLAILRNQAARDEGTFSEQVDRMEQIIGHQLGRASQGSAHQLLQRVEIKPVAERLGQAMTKVYADRFQSFDVTGPDLNFSGDERDLMEMLGNLLDNAYKYGRGRVQLELEQREELLSLHVDDDGPGVAQKLREGILQRGLRADSQAPGQGIGLAVVRDIAQSYGGRLEISQGGLGGARFSLVLPVSR